MSLSNSQLHGFLDTVFKCFINDYGYSLNKDVVDFLELQNYVESLKSYKEKHYAREECDRS